MPNPKNAPTADKPFLALSEAARIAGKSYTWARDNACNGLLDRRRPGGRGPILVTAESLAALLADDPFPAMRARVAKSRPPHLRLVVDNP